MICDARGLGAEEVFANGVAARMQLDDSEFENALRASRAATADGVPWSDAALSDLARALCVSRDVVAIELERRRRVPDGFYAQCRARWARRPVRPGRGGRSKRGTTRVQRVLRDLGTSAARAVSGPQGASLSPLDLGSVLGVKVEHLDAVLAELREAAW